MGRDLPLERGLGAWLRGQARAWEPRYRFAGAWRSDPDRWRAELRAELARLLRLPEVGPAEPRVVWQAPAEPHSLTLLEARLPGGIVGRAWLAAPGAPERGAPAVLLVPDERGPEVVAGQAGRAVDAAYGLAGDLAQKGLVVLAPELPGGGGAVDGLLALGRPVLGLQTAAGLAWLRYLRGRPDVDGRFIGAVGLGAGSRAATLAGCFEQRAALALCGGWEPWLPALRAGEAVAEGWALPGLLEIADWTDLVMLAWSGGLHVEAAAGKRGAAEAVDMARLLGEAREPLGHGEAARVVQAEADEDLPTPALEEFLEDWLLIPARG
jgi:hypothetical protein